MQNTLGDLNNHLFAELERLSDEELKGDELKDEMLEPVIATKTQNLTEIMNKILAVLENIHDILINKL